MSTARENMRPWGVELGGALVANFILPNGFIGQIWLLEEKWAEKNAYPWEVFRYKSTETDSQSLCFGTGQSYQDALLSIRAATELWLAIGDDSTATTIDETKRQLGFQTG